MRVALTRSKAVAADGPSARPSKIESTPSVRNVRNESNASGNFRTKRKFAH